MAVGLGARLEHAELAERVVLMHGNVALRRRAHVDGDLRVGNALVVDAVSHVLDDASDDAVGLGDQVGEILLLHLVGGMRRRGERQRQGERQPGAARCAFEQRQRIQVVAAFLRPPTVGPGSARKYRGCSPGSAQGFPELCVNA